MRSAVSFSLGFPSTSGPFIGSLLTYRYAAVTAVAEKGQPPRQRLATGAPPGADYDPFIFFFRDKAAYRF